jgi:hypothetical protein
MDAIQREFERFFDYLQAHAKEFSSFTAAPPPEAGALVRISRPVPVRRTKSPDRLWQIAQAEWSFSSLERRPAKEELKSAATTRCVPS